MLLLIFFIIMPVNANSNNWICFKDTQNSDTSNFVYYAQTDDICSEMTKMALSQEFQDYLQKNGINTNVYQLQLVSSSSDAHPQIIIHTLTMKPITLSQTLLQIVLSQTITSSQSFVQHGTDLKWQTNVAAR